MTTVVALVPAKDRADSVGATVRALRALAAVDRVVVVDDGSTDDTTGAARAAGAQVLRLASNVGKGGAVAAGVAAAPDADVFLLIDADVGADASHADRLLAPVLDHEADLVIGVLPSAGRRGGFGNVRRLARWGIRRGSGYDATAPLSGQRAVRAELIRGLTGSGRFGLEVAMTIDAARQGARIREVDVPMEHRHTGRSVSGFGHRGAQGLDIVRALWPRLLSRRARHVGLALLVLVGLAGSYLTGTAAVPSSVAPAGTAAKVVVFGVPHLGLDDVSAARMPNLYRLSTQGAYGMLTTRTGGNSASESGYATVGAGDKVSARSDSATALDRLESIEGDPAIAVLARRSGVTPRGAVLVPAIASTRRFAGAHVNSEPGALGDALRRAHEQTAVVANADVVNEDGTVQRNAPAALAVTTSHGAIDHGTVSHDLLRAAPSQPFGVEIDQTRFVAAARRAIESSAVTVLDPGETDRAAAYTSTMAKAEAEAARTAALGRTDAVLGAVASGLPPRTLLIVMGINSPGSAAALAPIVAVGAGVVPGRFESPSTRRSDLVTMTDIAPTILESLGLSVPPAMIGQAVRYGPGPPDRASLHDQNRLVQARDSTYNAVLDTFVWLQVAAYLFAAVVLLRRDTPKPVLRVVRGAVLTFAAWPIATFLLRLVPRLYELGAGTHLLVWVIAALIAWLATSWRTHALDPLLAIGAVSVVALCVDMAFGGVLQVSSFLGYTPTAAARFVGMGNTGFAVLAAGAVIVCACLVARSERPRDAWWLAAAVALGATVADGAPWLGSDVGGILCLVPVFGVMLYLLRGRHLSWRILGIAAAASVVVLGIAVGFEALRAPDQRTHIGRFFLGGGGSASFWTTIARKWSTNVRVLMGSTWSWLIPVIGGFLLVIAAFGRGWQRAAPKASPERIGLLALLATAVLGWAVNDSGALIGALVLVYAGPYLVLLCMGGADQAPPELLAPEPFEAGAPR